MVKLDNTPVSVEERIECQKMNISDADVAGHVGSKSELSVGNNQMSAPGTNGNNSKMVSSIAHDSFLFQFLPSMNMTKWFNVHKFGDFYFYKAF